MKVHVLHECIDSTDFYAESDVIAVSKDKEVLYRKMFDLYKECRDSEGRAVSQEETSCDKDEAFVVSENDSTYYRHHWKIDGFEV